MVEEKDKSLSKVEENKPAVDGLGKLDGLEDIDASDLIIPRIQISQPTSQTGATQGKLFNTATGEEYDEMEIVFLSVYKTRVRWEKSADGKIDLKAPPLCNSQNARAGVGDPGGNCDVCAMAQWGENSAKPECDLKYNFLGIILETRQPFIMTIGGASFKEGKKVINLCVQTKKPLYSYIFKILPELVMGQNGKYYKYIFNQARESDESELEEFKIYKGDYTSRAKKQNEDEIIKDEDKDKDKEEEVKTEEVPLPTIEVDAEGEEKKEEGDKEEGDKEEGDKEDGKEKIPF